MSQAGGKRIKNPPMRAGLRYNRLIAIRFVRRQARRTLWAFACDCGETAIVDITNARSGHAKSCGCLRREKTGALGRRITHGKTKTVEYYSWRAMIARCTNPRLPEYHRYGGRGIKVCKRWNRFENFFEDMGPRPSRLHSLDRYPNNDGNYEPGNCRWATKVEQSRNQRSNLRIMYQGRVVTLAEASERAGLKGRTVKSRLDRGWSTEDALTMPLRRRSI